jgi:hypothetical protein
MRAVSALLALTIISHLPLTSTCGGRPVQGGCRQRDTAGASHPVDSPELRHAQKIESDQQNCTLGALSGFDCFLVL